MGFGTFVLVLIVGFAVVPPLTRGWTNRIGATDDELKAVLPGDELVPSPRTWSTRAITIDAPPETVYALVAQMGYKRAGWYGWDWFYKATGSADFVEGDHSTRIVPELQEIGLGDHIYINKVVGYEVVRAEKGEAFVLLNARAVDGEDLPADDAARGVAGESWAWVMQPVGRDRTRLLLRIRSYGEDDSAFVQWLYDSPLDFGGAFFGYKTLRGIKRVAEDLSD